MACWFLQPHDHTRRRTSYFQWLMRWRDHKCTEKFRHLFGAIGPVCWYWPTIKRAICWTGWQQYAPNRRRPYSTSVVRRWNEFLWLGVGVWRWKCFWCYSSGIVICEFINFLQSYIQITLHWTLSSFSQFLSFHFIKLFSIKMENVNFHSTAIPRKFLTIKYFYRFLSIFWIFWHFLFTKKLPMTSLVTDDVSIFSLSIYFK